MATSFDTVDEKVAEVEFFLVKLSGAKTNWLAAKCFLSAFLSASRSVTLALQQFRSIPGFASWYEPHQRRLKNDPLARFFLDARNSHVHGGDHPLSGGSMRSGKVQYHFKHIGERTTYSPPDVVSACRDHFLMLLEIVYDCYLMLGVHIDPQQHYTRDHFESQGRTVDDAELEVWGWVMESLVEEGFSEDDRWHELRSYVGECLINHLFYSYLGKVTPQPNLPDYLEEVVAESSPEDQGWVHIPEGYDSVEDFLESIESMSRL